MNDEAMLVSDSGRSGAALGPHTVESLDESAQLARAGKKYATSTIYFPSTVPQDELLASVVIIPGYAAGEGTIAAWGAFLASHGLLAMTIGAKSPFRDLPRHRAAGKPLMTSLKSSKA